jgi:mono/diheme cytochrome c family protein
MDLMSFHPKNNKLVYSAALVVYVVLMLGLYQWWVVTRGEQVLGVSKGDLLMQDRGRFLEAIAQMDHKKNDLAYNLDDPHMISIGAGEYDRNCANCHSRPRFNSGSRFNADYTSFGTSYSAWNVYSAMKRGPSWMPAFTDHDNEYSMWSTVAFTRILPTLTADEYDRMVAGSPKGREGLVDAPRPR